MEKLKLTTPAEKELANRVLDAFAKHYTGYGTGFSKYLNDFKECYHLNQPKLEVGKVYKVGDVTLFVQEVNKEIETFTGYGLNRHGVWEISRDWNLRCDWQEATPEEWLDALKKEAKKRGYYDNKCLVNEKVYPKVTDLEFYIDFGNGTNVELSQGLSDKVSGFKIWNSIDGWVKIVVPPEPKNDVEKPPLGLKPLFIHNEHRLNEIMEAIKNYSNANKSIPKEWVNELENLQLTLLQTKK